MANVFFFFDTPIKRKEETSETIMEKSKNNEQTNFNKIL